MCIIIHVYKLVDYDMNLTFYYKYLSSKISIQKFLHFLKTNFLSNHCSFMYLPKKNARMLEVYQKICP